MEININRLNYNFSQKPLLVGGRAMEFYGLRKSGEDIDLIVSVEDIQNLIKLYPDKVKDIYGDLGVCPFNFEIWKTIRFLNYDDLKDGAIEQQDHLVISLKNLLHLKALAMEKEKYLEDTRLISKEINKRSGAKLAEMTVENTKITSSCDGIKYLERRN